MTLMLNMVAVFLLGNLLVALVRIWRGPQPADRMLASQLFGTTGVALMLVLAQAQSMASLRDVALILALLSVIAVVAFVTRVVGIDSSEEKARSERPRPESERP
ncbi:monovalent cation/H+ antiporter complex subunit F [Marinobacter sp. TBZ242]|uniref:Monovalent cation/H+ antiporter complex subunit F n=1 Tax=Marinobacter azerbaijanicus TaxID=3050455 RepID=A0ABT7IBB5_9GAMM|nr:monovalent cation/H+ antiporter complex subunit F [Marinobacter sp. TBZ242]MDL0431455.1 monovalent cation/H+ antiporter complex subunit F [Marinobacter sp. TBZ242]